MLRPFYTKSDSRAAHRGSGRVSRRGAPCLDPASRRGRLILSGRYRSHENNYFTENVQRFRGGLVFKAHRLDGADSYLSGRVSRRGPPCLDPASRRGRRIFSGRYRSQMLRAAPIGTVLNLRTTTSQKCAAVPRRARN